jgi:hypothetical protein
MRALVQFRKVLPFLFAVLFSMWTAGQSLVITNGVWNFTSLTNSTVTMSGSSELWLITTNAPLSGSTVNLESPDAWIFLPNLRPSLATTYLSQFRVNGLTAISGGNVRVVEYAMGSVVIPHAPSFRPLQIFTGPQFTGSSNFLSQYAAYSDAALGAFNNTIRSFHLKRGYMATFAQNGNGTGLSKTFVAQDGDLDVGAMPSGLDNSVSFVRVFPWRWSGKKGIAGDITQNLNIRWFYNWNLDQNSAPDLEYVPIRQNRYWPDLNQDWRARGATHLLGYNEPDHADQANMAVADAIASWPDLLASGLRVGAPAVSDGGLSWLYSFIDQADAAGLRVDFVPVHYYRCYGNAADPDGAATQFYNFLKGIYDRVQRPLWVTEWNNGAGWTTCADPTFAQQQAAILKMTAMLDSAPFVERYAVYNWVEDVRRLQWDDGSLTAAGVTYRDRVSPLSYAQDGPPGGSRSVSRFPLEGDALDASGFANNALAIGKPLFTTGYIGQAAKLDGTNSYLQFPANTANSATFSFAAWIFWEGGGNWQRIFDFGNDTSHYIFLTPRSGSGTMRFVINAGAGEQLIETTALPIGVWRHVAVTLSGGFARLLINGVQVASSTTFTANPSQFNPKRNYLGKSQFTADPLFRGRIDEVTIKDTVFTGAELAAMNATIIRSWTILPNGALQITATGAANQTYKLQGAEQLILPTSWTTLSSSIANTTGALTFQDSDMTNFIGRFYRITTP